jgi:hypothetical protein
MNAALAFNYSNQRFYKRIYSDMQYMEMDRRE